MMAGLLGIGVVRRFDRKIYILEINLPDELSHKFIESIDEEGRRLFRHMPSAEKEIQFWNFDLNRSEFAPMKTHYRLVAYGALWEEGQGEASWALCVHQNYRRQGLARYNYPFAVDLARSHGFKVLKAEMDEDNIAPIKMHTRLGYEMSDPEDDGTGRKIIRARLEIR